MRPTSLKWAVFAGFLASGAVPATAKVSPQTEATLEVGISGIFSSDPDPHTATFALFDPSLGTLNSVTLCARATGLGEFIQLDESKIDAILPQVSKNGNILTDFSSYALSIAREAGLNVGLSIFGKSQIGNGSALISLNGNSLQFACEDCGIGSLNFTSGKDDLNQFQGIGSATVPYDLSYGAALNIPPDFIISHEERDLFLDGSLTYEFTIPAAVPEPETWALMLIGFGIVGFNLRSRRRSIIST